MSAVERGNETALSRLMAADPVLVDVRPARDVLPAMTGRTLLHAGPPITWPRMCGPMRGAVTGALCYERWAKNAADAEALAAAGEIAYAPCHHAGAVGPMAGIVSPSMFVLVVENRAHGNRAFATLNEGLGRVLRYGANDEAVIARLAWMEEVLGPALSEAVHRIEGGLDLRGLIAQALQMGDEGHNRNRAGTSLFFRAVARPLLDSGLSRERLAAASPDVLVMHPGPMNEGVEIAPDVATDPRSVITDQVANGVAIRMALLYLLAGAREDAVA